MAFGWDPSELCQDCFKSAIDPQFKGLWQDCKEPENPVSGIARLREDCGGPPAKGPNLTTRNPGAIGVCTNPFQSERNPSELHQGRSKFRIQSQSVRIANTEVSIAGGLRQPERPLFGDCGAPRGLQRIPEQLPGPALQSGLRPDGQPLG